MKQNLFNKLWLRVGMIVAIMTTALSGTAWGADETITFSSLSLENGVQYTTINGADCVLTFGSGSNDGKYYNTGAAIRVYGGGHMTVSSTTKTIESIALTFGSGDGSNEITTNVGTYNNGTWSGSNNSVTFTVGGTSGHRRIASVAVTYAGGGSTLTASDLAITNASTALVFDLYNNASAQTVSYTTSGTGAVTVSGGEGYVMTSVNESTKTITVTPLAVTPSAQTITVNQAADATYAAGSATFTVNITDSTPFNGVIFDATEDKDSNNTSQGAGSITKGGVTFSCTSGILGNGSEYRMYKSSTTTISTTDGSLITKIEFTNANSYPATGFGSQTGWTTSNNGGVWEGEAESVSFEASGAQVRATLIKVTVEANTNPSIIASNVDIEYNATSGSISYTLTNEVTGGVLSAEITGGNEDNWLSLGTVGATVPFTCTANSTATERTAQVTLTYTYNTSETITKTITITQAGNPNVVDEISDIAETGDDYAVRGTVVAFNARGFVLGDGTGYVYTYLNADPRVAVGDIKKISGTMGSYNGVFQFTSSASIEVAESSNYNNTPAVQILDATAIAGYNSETLHLSNYVQFEGTLIKSNNYYNIVVSGLDNTASIAYPTTAQATELDALLNKTVTVKGYFAGVSSGHFNVVMESVEEVEVQHNEYTLTVSNLSNVEMYVFDAADESESLLEGEGTVQIYDGTQVLVSVTAADGYELESLVVDGTDVTSQIDETTGAYTFNMPTHNVTVTATAVEYVAPVTAQYTLATSITSGKTYVIAGQNGDKIYVMAEQKSNNRGAVEGTLSGTTLTAADACEFTVEVVDNKYTFYDAVNDGYLYAASSSSNHLKTQSTLDDNGKWTIEINGETGVASVVAQGTNTRNVMRFNYNGGSPLFACYASTSSTGSPVYLYEKVEAVEPETESVSVTAAGYATYCSANALDFTDVTEITAYVGTIDGTHLTFTPITQVPANTGLLLKATTAGSATTVNVPVIASAPELTITNCLTGTNEAITLDEDDYILNVVNGKAGFYRATANHKSLGAHKAYIAKDAGQGVKSFIFDDDDATAISTVESFTEEGAIYNLAGQRISKMQKGINIVNGKKILK